MKLSANYLIAFAWAIVFTGCHPFEAKTYPNVEMSAAESSQLKDALDRLDRAINAAAPSIAAQLHAGADEAQIAHLRSALGGAVNQPLEEWFAWHNGAKSRMVSILPLAAPLSIDAALEDRNFIRKVPLVSETRRNSLKILDDFAGDGYFIDLRSGTPFVFYDMLEDPGEGYFGTLTEFANFIADCFEADVFSADESGFLDYDEDLYYQLESVYFERASRP